MVTSSQSRFSYQSCLEPSSVIVAVNYFTICFAPRNRHYKVGRNGIDATLRLSFVIVLFHSVSHLLVIVGCSFHAIDAVAQQSVIVRYHHIGKPQ